MAGEWSIISRGQWETPGLLLEPPRTEPLMLSMEPRARQSFGVCGRSTPQFSMPGLWLPLVRYSSPHPSRFLMSPSDERIRSSIAGMAPLKGSVCEWLGLQIGFGLITMPYSLSQMGLAWGIAATFVYGLLGAWTVYLIVWLYLEYKSRLDLQGKLPQERYILQACAFPLLTKSSTLNPCSSSFEKHRKRLLIWTYR